MAHKYVRSSAGGAGTGADWTNAYTTLKAAAEAAGTAAGDNIWVAHDHAETLGAAISITFKNTAAAPGTCICVDAGGTVPPVSADLRTTATVTTTGAFAITILGVATGFNWVEGITFSAGSGAVNSIITIGTVSGFLFKNCKFQKAGTTANTSSISISSAQLVIWDNTTVQFGAIGDSIAPGGVSGLWIWRNTPSAIQGAIIPTNLFFGAIAKQTYLHGVDLSALGSNNLFPAASTSGAAPTLANCKLGASATLLVPTTPGRSNVLINCDSGDTNYRVETYQYPGIGTTETTIVRSGGATDGTMPISWKIATNTNAEWLLPYESLPITIWNETLSSQTLTLYGYIDQASVPTNREIWIVAEYLGTSGSSRSSFVSSGAADYLAAPANLTEDTVSTWGGGDTTIRFELAVTFTAAERGPVTVRIYAAKVSATFYVDPKPVISGLTVSRSNALQPGMYVNELVAAGAAGGGASILGGTVVS